MTKYTEKERLKIIHAVQKHIDEGMTAEKAIKAVGTNHSFWSRHRPGKTRKYTKNKPTVTEIHAAVPNHRLIALVGTPEEIRAALAVLHA